MECTGTLKTVTKDWLTDKFVMTFEINENVSHEVIEDIRKCKKLSIIAEEYKEKRSRDANAYFHVLCGKLADKLRISKPRMKNILLYRYGQSEMIDDVEATMHSNVPPSKILEQEEMHFFPIGTDDEGLTIYRIQRKSRTYNSLEMSILIDGVVDECKEHGIETMTPEQLARMMDLWEKNHG
jgi:hypothetical protein